MHHFTFHIQVVRTFFLIEGITSVLRCWWMIPWIIFLCCWKVLIYSYEYDIKYTTHSFTRTYKTRVRYAVYLTQLCNFPKAFEVNFAVDWIAFHHISFTYMGQCIVFHTYLNCISHTHSGDGGLIFLFLIDSITEHERTPVLMNNVLFITKRSNSSLGEFVEAMDGHKLYLIKEVNLRTLNTFCWYG